LKSIRLLLLGLAALCGNVHAAPPPPEEIADIPVTMMVELGSGQVLHARKPDLSFVPASMTKVMTAYVAFEEIVSGRLSLDRTFTVHPQTARQWNGRGTSMFLTANETVSTHDLLRGIMTASANDASVALAEGYVGNVPAWTFMMNDSAKRLGMTKSAFNTPNGWPDEGKTFVSARDLVKLAASMIDRFPTLYRRYSGIKEFEWNGARLISHDPVTGVVPGADGIKTGYTREAGYNFLGSAERDGRRLVMVIAGARSERDRAEASRAFLEWAFSEWRARPLFARGTLVGTARVQGGSRRNLALITRQPIHATIPADSGNDDQIRLSIRYRGPIAAPIDQGAKVADLEIRVGNLPPSHLPLYAKHAVSEAGPMDRLFNGLMNLIS